MSIIKSPDEVFGDLFHAVQMAGIFPDSKTFVDCTPKHSAQEILANYKVSKGAEDFDLKKFVLAHFTLPHQYSTDFQGDAGRPVREHINLLWQVLKRDSDLAVEGSSLIPLPHPYVVPGGRFGEIYYWDSYFTMLGLAISGQLLMIEHMVKNFAHLIDRFGHVPNGNRSYFLSRSQPPFFAMTVRLLADLRDDGQVIVDFLPQLRREYAFWMDGVEQLQNEGDAHRRVVRLTGGTLNRYWDDAPSPRQESFHEDVELAAASGRDAQEIYRDLRAACESGWDFSVRWCADKLSLDTIETTQIIPVDLNCLLYHLELTIANGLRLTDAVDEAQGYRRLAEQRAALIQKYCWSEEKGTYQDYQFVRKVGSDVPSMAAVFPLFFMLANASQAQRTAEFIENHLLKDGGYVTTAIHSGQQWDAPNGWAPLQYIAFQAFKNYGMDTLALEGARRWIRNNLRVYNNTAKLVEKYNVEDLSLLAGGGEYPVQDGFGWTNGVLLKLMQETNWAPDRK